MSYIFCSLLLALGQLSSGLPQNKPLRPNPTELLLMTSESRIVGGNDAPEGYAPHQMALLYGVSFTVMLCGASIISANCVLTAVHCIEAVVTWQGELSSSLYGVVGSNRWDQATTQIWFKRYVNHPEWDARNIKNDIGVLITAQEIVLTARTAVVPLRFKEVGGGEEAYVTGWGRLGLSGLTPEKLQLLYTTTLSPEQCEYDLEQLSRVLGPTLPMDPKVEICTFHSCGHGMCHGDSGSALVSKLTGEQIGIVSWGFPCAVGAPDIYVRVSAYASFVEEVRAKATSS